MNRRTLLRASAAALGGSAATAAVVAAGSDDATGQTALVLDVAGDSATLGADESVTALTLAVDVEWAYDLPDTASPATVMVELAAGVDDTSVVASAESAQLFTSAEGSESFDVDLVSEGAVEASALAPATGEQSTTLTVEARLRVEGSGAVLARDVATATPAVTVTREADASDYGSVGGSGELTIETGGE